jgi:hypothetical protein
MSTSSLGGSSSQGLNCHHVVPGLGDDTTFMPGIGRTQVSPELPDRNAQRLTPAL